MRARKRRPRSATYVPRWLFELRRRSLLFGVVQPEITAAMKRRVKLQFGSKCVNCGATRRLHFDHHMPLCKGYALVYGNMAILCASCNMRKGGQHPEFFYTPAKYREVRRMLAEQRTW